VRPFFPLSESDGTHLCVDCVVKSHQRFDDSDIVEFAKRYAGVLTKSVVVFESKTSLEVKYREERKVVVGSFTVFDFPLRLRYIQRPRGYFSRSKSHFGIESRIDTILRPSLLCGWLGTLTDVIISAAISDALSKITFFQNRAHFKRSVQDKARIMDKIDCY